MLWSFWTVAFPFMRRDVKHIQACSYWDWDDIDLLEMRLRSCACLFCPALFFHFAGTQCLQNQLKEGHVHNMQWSNFYAWALWGLTLSIQLVQGRRDHGGIDRKLNSDRGGADYTLHTVRSSAIIEPRASCFLHRCPAPITIWCFFKTPEFWRQWTFDLFDFLRKVLPWPLCVLSRQDPFSLTDHYFWSESFAIVDTVCFYNPSKFGVWARKPAGFMHCNRASHEKHRKRGRRGHSERQPFWTTEALWGERVYQTLHWVLGSHGSGRLAELPKVLQADWTLISLLRVQDFGNLAHVSRRDSETWMKAVFVVYRTEKSSARRPGDKDSKWPGSQVRGHCEHSNCTHPCCISCLAFTHVLSHVHT